jgi:fatty acid elongase 3
MTAAGYKIWWKKYLTTLQITQFVVDLFVVYFAGQFTLISSHRLVLTLYVSPPAYSYFASEYFLGIAPVVGTCSGTEGAAVFGCAILTSYLFLFIVRPSSLVIS